MSATSRVFPQAAGSRQPNLHHRSTGLISAEGPPAIQGSSSIIITLDLAEKFIPCDRLPTLTTTDIPHDLIFALSAHRHRPARTRALVWDHTTRKRASIIAVRGEGIIRQALHALHCTHCTLHSYSRPPVPAVRHLIFCCYYCRLAGPSRPEISQGESTSQPSRTQQISRRPFAVVGLIEFVSPAPPCRVRTLSLSLTVASSWLSILFAVCF